MRLDRYAEPFDHTEWIFELKYELARLPTSGMAAATDRTQERTAQADSERRAHSVREPHRRTRDSTAPGGVPPGSGGHCREVEARGVRDGGQTAE